MIKQKRDCRVVVNTASLLNGKKRPTMTGCGEEEQIISYTVKTEARQHLLQQEHHLLDLSSLNGIVILGQSSYHIPKWLSKQ